MKNASYFDIDFHRFLTDFGRQVGAQSFMDLRGQHGSQNLSKIDEKSMKNGYQKTTKNPIGQTLPE